MNEVNKKVEEANLTLGDFENAKRKLAAENADLLRQLQELENSANMLSKYKIQLVSQLEETKKVADDGAKEQLDEEVGLKEDVLRQLNKSLQEADMWRQKFETEGLAKAEDLEMTKMKLQARLTEATSTIDQMNAKLGQVDKAKCKLQAEIDETSAQLDAAHILNSSMEKKAKQFDKIVQEWKMKVDGLGMDLDVAQKEARKENKVLSNEIKDIMDQISEGGRSIHEIDKI